MPIVNLGEENHYFRSPPLHPLIRKIMSKRVLPKHNPNKKQTRIANYNDSYSQLPKSNMHMHEHCSQKAKETLNTIISLQTIISPTTTLKPQSHKLHLNHHLNYHTLLPHHHFIPKKPHPTVLLNLQLHYHTTSHCMQTCQIRQPIIMASIHSQSLKIHLSQPKGFFKYPLTNKSINIIQEPTSNTYSTINNHHASFKQ